MFIIYPKKVNYLFFYIESGQGVFNDRYGTKIDHGVVIVRYNIENGIDFWFVRTS